MREASYHGAAVRGGASVAPEPPGFDDRLFVRLEADLFAIATIGERDAVEVAQRPMVSVIIPTVNEALNLPIVLERLPGIVDEVIIVDGCSTDGTPEVARQCRPDAVVIEEAVRRGKGAALRAGFAAATGDIVVMIDADGSTAPEEIPLHVRAILDGAEVVKGSRFLPGGDSHDLTPLRRFGNLAICTITNVLWGMKYTDLCYGFMTFRREALDRIDVDVDGFEVETFLGIRIAQEGFAVAEVPSVEADRISGTSNLSVVRDGLRIARTLLRERLRPTNRKAAAPAGTAPANTAVNLPVAV